jgi:hypothetical protein
VTSKSSNSAHPLHHADWLRSEFQALLRRARDYQGVADKDSLYAALAAVVAEALSDLEPGYAKAWIEALNGAEGRFRAAKQPG